MLEQEEKNIIFNSGIAEGRRVQEREPPTRATVYKVYGLLQTWRKDTEGVTFYDYINIHWNMTDEEIEHYNKMLQSEREKAELFKPGSFLSRFVSWITKRKGI